MAVLDDSDVEGDETFLVRLSSPRNATVRDGEGTATIEGDDGTELPTLAIDDVAVNEDAGSAVFSVTLSEQSAETVTVGRRWTGRRKRSRTIRPRMGR